MIHELYEIQIMWDKIVSLTPKNKMTRACSDALGSFKRHTKSFAGKEGTTKDVYFLNNSRYLELKVLPSGVIVTPEKLYSKKYFIGPRTIIHQKLKNHNCIGFVGLTEKISRILANRQGLTCVCGVPSYLENGSVYNFFRKTER